MKLAFFPTALLVVHAAAASTLLPPDCTDTPAIVIGAGISGIAAARELVARGCNVTLLEAKDVLGGRMESIEFGGEVVDLHAAFIHGSDTEQNSIRWLTEIFDIPTVVSGGNSAFRGEEIAIWKRSNGVNLTEDEIDKGYDLLDRWYDFEAWNLGLDYEARIADSTLFDAPLKLVEQQAIEIMRTGNGNRVTIDNEFDEALLDFHLSSYFDTDWGLSRWQHSVNGMSTDWDWKEYPGVDRNIPGGVYSVIEKLVDDIDSAYLTIQPNTVVTKIRYDESVGCAVDTTDPGISYTSGSCLVTIPIAVMKDNADTFFEPQLPNDKAKAIDRAGVAGLNKLFVKWSRKFWEDSAAFYIIGGDLSNPFNAGFHTGQLFGRSDSTVTQHFFGGDDFAYGIESGDNDIKNAVLDVMQNAFPIAGITKQDIVDFYITTHRYEPFARGSYSAPRTYFNGNADREILARPIGNTLFFGGEHTNTGGRYASMDGAYDAGIRAASDLAAAEQNVAAGVGQSAVYKNPNQPGNPNNRDLLRKMQGNGGGKSNGPVFPGHGLSQATKNSGKFRNKFNKP